MTYDLYIDENLSEQGSENFKPSNVMIIREEREKTSGISLEKIKSASDIISVGDRFTHVATDSNNLFLNFVFPFTMSIEDLLYQNIFNRHIRHTSFYGMKTDYQDYQKKLKMYAKKYFWNKLIGPYSEELIEKHFKDILSYNYQDDQCDINHTNKLQELYCEVFDQSNFNPIFLDHTFVCDAYYSCLFSNLKYRANQTIDKFDFTKFRPIQNTVNHYTLIDENEYGSLMKYMSSKFCKYGSMWNKFENKNDMMIGATQAGIKRALDEQHKQTFNELDHFDTLYFDTIYSSNERLVKIHYVYSINCAKYDFDINKFMPNSNGLYCHVEDNQKIVDCLHNLQNNVLSERVKKLFIEYMLKKMNNYSFNGFFGK